MNKIRIKNKQIGGKEPCFIIAEAGVNHNGSLKVAKKLVDVAAEAGADAVKFQTFVTDDLVVKNAPKAKYQKRAGGVKESQYSMLKKLELSNSDTLKLKRYSEQKSIIFLSTPYDIKSVDFLERLNVPAYKISSADITNYTLLSHVAKKDKPIIVSTGMSTLGEIEAAVDLIENERNDKIVLLHCNFNYPANFSEVNLKSMETLKKAFHHIVGYSDHTLGIEVAIAAVALGANVIEKHFTLSRALDGPDHKASLEPKELKEMVNCIRNVEKSIGSSIKKPTKSEICNIKVSRRSIVATEDIPSGTIITKEKIKLKRPGTGLSPIYQNIILGFQTRVDIKKGDVLTWEMFK